MTKNEPIDAKKLANAKEPMGATVLAGGQVDLDVLRKTEETVAFEWKPGDVILDLYEVRSVTEGFGEDAQEKNYHQGGFGRVYKVWHRTWRREMAVKTPRAETFTRQEQKDNFIRECETWINLGLHPHIAACHYVRELGGVPRVFSEYAAAGTLEEWIRSERLYAGGEQAALARILDMCIQFAWGLHYAHERGVIHQDVKPLNVLLWDDGTLKVTDYGLAGARQKAGLAGMSPGMQTVMVSMGGMTPSHCSPEQASGQMLDRRTDVWSWAVSVLEMFQGGVTWQTGSLAAAALEVFLKHGGKEEGIPGVPAGVADLLRRCFQSNPADRPRTLDDCAKVLCAVYEAESGEPYHRAKPQGASDTADALNNRALSFIDLGKPDEAEKLFERASQLDKHHLAATYNKSLMQWRRARMSDSDLFRNLEEIKKEYPDDATVECALGYIGMENADFARARLNFERAINLGGDGEARKGLEEAQRLSQFVAVNPRVFGEHPYGVHSAAVSPDGRSILTGSGDSTLRLWDVASGRCVRSFKGGATRVAYSPDGRVALTGKWGTNTELQLWDVVTGQRVRIQQTGGVESLAFSPDGKFALSGGTDKTLRLWDVTTLSCLRTFEGHDSKIVAVAFSPDGRFALSGSWGKLQLWDVATWQCLRCFGKGATSAAFSPDSRFVLSGWFGELHLWDVSTGQCLRTLEEHGQVHSVAFSPDGRFALSGTEDKTLRLWNVATGQCLRTFEHEDKVPFVAFSPDGRCAFSGSFSVLSVIQGKQTVVRDGKLRSWDIPSLMGGRSMAPWLYSTVITAEEALARERTHNSLLSRARQGLEAGQIAEALALVSSARAVEGFERSPESLTLQARIAAHARVKSFRGGWMKRTFEGPASGAKSVAFSPDGRFALSRDSQKLRLWDVATTQCLRTFEVPAGRESSVAFSPDGRFALSGLDFTETMIRDDQQLVMQLWDVAMGQCLHTFEGHFPVAFSPDGRHAVSASNYMTLRLWDVSTGQCLRAFEKQETLLRFAVFSPDGHYVLSEDSNKLRLWDVAAGRCLRIFEGHEGSVWSMAFSPDGRFALSGSEDKTVRLWDVATGQCLRTFEGHQDVVFVSSVALSPDGRYAVSGDSLALRLWDVATGRCLRAFEGHGVSSVAFSPDGRFVLSGGTPLRLWEIDWEYEYDPKHDPDLTLKPVGVS